LDRQWPPRCDSINQADNAPQRPNFLLHNLNVRDVILPPLTPHRNLAWCAHWSTLYLFETQDFGVMFFNTPIVAILIFAPIIFLVESTIQYMAVCGTHKILAATALYYFIESLCIMLILPVCRMMLNHHFQITTVWAICVGFQGIFFIIFVISLNMDSSIRQEWGNIKPF
jgi:hypothetical protein